MKRITAVLAFVLILAPVAATPESQNETRAQTTSTTETAPALDQILDKYVQALGGKAAFEKLTSRVTTQSMSRPDGEARVEIFEKAPNKRLVATTLADSSKLMTGFDGAVGWGRNQNGELQEIKDLELANLRQNSEFYREIKLKDEFPQMKLKGKETLEGRVVYLIEAPTASGRMEKMYFDAQSGLLVRRMQQVVAFIRQSDDEIPEAKIIDVEYDYEDYRAVDGVKLPFLIRRRMPIFVSTIKVKEVKHNVAIDDAKFKKPAS